ncbi:hypothetical protein RFI_12982 [Reticulomyxa filosa]|uniref:Uncharacterized protein n=1 Tax=Reticulomyxa filosa TaxID=46433 RepID=X6NE62_RETFI|nr:hypothetical protein RFI_12982 [Reticulomyxa filosa]|eukprot:ETO24178.1 hypothetical protein RFI_12982 [Reticulomyxa filosa]
MHPQKSTLLKNVTNWKTSTLIQLNSIGIILFCQNKGVKYLFKATHCFIFSSGSTEKSLDWKTRGRTNIGLHSAMELSDKTASTSEQVISSCPVGSNTNDANVLSIGASENSYNNSKTSSSSGSGGEENNQFNETSADNLRLRYYMNLKMIPIPSRSEQVMIAQQVEKKHMPSWLFSSPSVSDNNGNGSDNVYSNGNSGDKAKDEKMSNPNIKPIYELTRDNVNKKNVVAIVTTSSSPTPFEMD